MTTTNHKIKKIAPRTLLNRVKKNGTVECWVTGLRTEKYSLGQGEEDFQINFLEPQRVKVTIDLSGYYAGNSINDLEFELEKENYATKHRWWYMLGYSAQFFNSEIDAQEFFKKRFNVYREQMNNLEKIMRRFEIDDSAN